MAISKITPAQAIFLLRQHDNRTPFGSFVGEGRELGGVGDFRLGDVRAGKKQGGLAIAQGDCACFVQQENIHVSRGFHRASRHRNDVSLDHVVHSGDADGRQQATNRRGDQADEQRDEDENALWGAGVYGVGLKRDDG